MTRSQYVNELVKKFLRCGDIYENYSLNEIFTEGLDVSIRHSKREYWGNKKDANLRDRVFLATYLL